MENYEHVLQKKNSIAKICSKKKNVSKLKNAKIFYKICVFEKVVRNVLVFFWWFEKFKNVEKKPTEMMDILNAFFFLI